MLKQRDQAMRSISTIWFHLRRAVPDLLADRRGMAAVEFAFILPVMLVMFFGTIEFSSAIAIDRKVTLMARTLSDLTSQATTVADSDLTNFFAASTGIMTPYPTTTLSSTITELYVDPNTLAARVQWSKGSAPLSVGTTVTIPSALAIAGSYLILSQVSYVYVPTVGYVMAKAGITMSDFAYTRPRQSTCVSYPTAATGCTTS
jgi:Flp pilus assembly protein TadG